MTTRRPHRLGVEGLEVREMLSGAPKGAVMPYVELTLKGHFVAGAPTTVVFAARHGESIGVTPASVTKTSVVVAVPAFFDPTTGQPVASTASVSVDQTVGGKVKDIRVIKGLAIAALPKTGLLAGDVLGAVTNEAATVTADAAGRFAQIAQNPAGPQALKQVAAQVEADLGQVEQFIPQAQQILTSLAFGAVGSAPLGTFQGQTATLDVNQLGLLDRIVAAGIDDAAGSTSQGVALVQSLDNLVSGAAAAGPRAVIARAKGVVDVLATATGSSVVPPAAELTGLVVGSLSAIVAAAEAEAQIILSPPPAPCHSSRPPTST